MLAVRIIQWITRVAGLVTLLLGLTIWITGIDLRNFHMSLGIIIALSLLVLSIMAVFTDRLRLLGLAGIVYALFLPTFGVTQVLLLMGNAHWLIQVAHLLVGLGALALVQIMGERYISLKQTGSGVREPQMQSENKAAS